MQPQYDKVKPTVGYDGWMSMFATTTDQTEVIGYMLYSRATFVSGTTQALTFFNTQPATQLDGNLVLAGQLPAQNSFLIQAIRIAILPDTSELAAAAPAAGAAAGSLQDAIQIARDGTATLKIGQKDYGTWPIAALPGAMGGFGEFGNVGDAGNFAGVQSGLNGSPDPRAAYSLAQPLAIPATFNFSIECSWNASIATNQNSITMIAMLDGQLARPAQ